MRIAGGRARVWNREGTRSIRERERVCEDARIGGGDEGGALPNPEARGGGMGQ
jgi:hypothetical protein